MGFLVHEFALADMTTKQAIVTAGGKLIVTEKGKAKRVQLYDPKTFAPLTLGAAISAVRGVFKFAVLDTVLAVDCYGVAPGGQSFQIPNMVAQSSTNYEIDTMRPHHCMVIPFDFSMGVAELDTGFDEPAGAIFVPDGCGIKVTAVDAAITVDVGTATAEAGDPDGFISAASVAALGVVLDRGAFLDNAGAYISKVSTAKSIVTKLSAGADTAEGFAYLPYMLPTVGA